MEQHTNHTQSFETLTSDNIEYLMKLEDEHLRLQRQVRQIQTDRSHRVQGVHPQLQRQDTLLNVLQKEYVSLKTDLKIAKSGAHKKNAKHMKNYLRKALIEHERILQECEGGINIISEFNGLLQRNKKNLLQLRASVNASRGQALRRKYQIESRLVSMENNLETAMLRFNVVQNENQKLRAEIESLLKDRALFNRNWSKMINILNKGKKFLNDLFESSSVAYDQRDEWVKKLRAITERAKLDQNLQVQEMRDLQKAVDHEAKLHEFLLSKGIIRINKYAENKEKKLKQINEAETKDLLNKHGNILEDVYEYTNEHNIDRIIEKFVKTEAECFSIYKLSTDTSAENIVLQKELAALQRDIDDRKDWMLKMDCEMDNKLKELRKEISEARKKNEDLQRLRREQDKIINHCMSGVQEMFNMLKCSLEPYANLLGDKKPSTWNHQLTFQLLTEQIRNYIQIVYYYERGQHKKIDWMDKSKIKKYTVSIEPQRHILNPPINYMVPANPCPACIEARWMSRISDNIEKPFDKHMTKEALQELINEPAYERSDRLHMLTECTSPKSRIILAKRYM